MRNIELKARLPDLEAARKTAQSIATERLGIQNQKDTYFHCQQGRLKLRQIDGMRSELIWYDRPNRREAKPSDYQVVPVSNPQTLKLALTAALGIRGIVDKQREIFLVNNVRIHLDEVASLGQFLEFEAVLGPDTSDEAGHEQLEQLLKQFGLRREALLAGSYSEMISQDVS